MIKLFCNNLGNTYDKNIWKVIVMKNKFKIILVIIGLVIILLLTFIIVNQLKVEKQENFINSIETSKYQEENSSNMQSTKKAIIVKVNSNYLTVLGMENETHLYEVSFSNEGDIGFKQGQEVLIYFDGTILLSNPARITTVGKIEIIKEKSNKSIPEEILRRYEMSNEQPVSQ